MFVVHNSFGILDYVVFAATLVVAMGIGLWFAVRGGGQKTQDEYLKASRSMSVVPVAISILVSFFSAILILGTPAEMYTQGTEFYIYTLGMILGIILASVLFVPLLYPLKLTSVFEYLEIRFRSRTVRLIGTLMMFTNQILYIGVASFAPAIAFEAVTGIPVWATLVTTGSVATIYTTIGGIKAVIWTDVFQALIMMAGIMSILIQGTIKVGSWSRVWEISQKWERIKFFNFDPDPRVRHTFWNLVLAQICMSCSIYGISQPSVQRYSSLPTIRHATQSVLLNIIGVFLLLTLTCMSGLALFAFYADQNCNPLGQSLVSNPNQLVPYFVMENLGYPGIPGLFIACLFSGALSSVSSSLNALGAITWEDILKPRFEKTLTESQKTFVTKIIVLIFGVVSIGISFLATQLEGSVVQISLSLTGATSGPLTGMFFLGALFPWTNSYGAISGALVGFALTSWMSIGSFVNGVRLPFKPFPNGTCPSVNVDTFQTTIMSHLTHVTTTAATVSKALQSNALNTRSALDDFYSVSYAWFPTVGMSLTIVVGLVVSFITGPNKLNDVPTKYVIPLADRLCCFCPARWRFWLNCKREFRKPEVCGFFFTKLYKLTLSVWLKV
ncbi:sodium-coupled monocarboxylate transporter 1-like [Biomphalaria glabrata]|uniref:Sodium-coupled monocarboxylate transporter 1-like n=1 Tax=Biomphalaria glabrata TaxID=6526 RepID=A0A9W2ZC73_BIOGL|nr:sodium-coupled monocarboxylate transporter 1-like [Biomphalaria glabrata]